MDDLRRSRLLCAWFWVVVLVAAAIAFVAQQPTTALFAFTTAVVVSLLTVVMSKLSREEQLVQPVAYRIAVGALLFIAVAGGVIALLPGVSDASLVYGAFFALVAVLAYRALVAPGPSRAIATVVIAMWTWIPFAAVTLIGCRRYDPHEPPHWSELASMTLLRLALLLLPVVAVAGLLAFVPRRDEVPVMRVVR